MSAAAVAVRRARVRDVRGDALAAQLRVARLLTAADVSTGLPRGSLLVVRKLADPLPGVLAAERHGLRPPAAWERALRDALVELARGAARPAHGAVPAGANAVYFGDEAELLACLALDVADGVSASRWWWPEAAARASEPRLVLAHALVERAHAVPAAFERLIAVRRLASVVTLLGRSSQTAVLHAVAQRFAVPLPEAATPFAPPAAATRASVLRPAAPRTLVTAIRQAAPEAVEPALPAAARTLVALALVLQRAPALARAPSFFAALEAVVAPELAPVPEATLHGAVEAAFEHPRPAEAVKGRVRLPRPRVDAPGPPAAEPPRYRPRPQEQVSAERPHPVEAASPEVRLTDGPPLVATELGGVLFLANVALSLGLYGDFTQPRRPGIGLDVWRFISLLGVRLLGRRPQRRDPLWALLGTLAGPDAPGFRPPARVPRSWLEQTTPRDRALLARVPGRSVDEFVTRAAVCTRARLRASGLDADALLRRPARVTVDDTRLDATFDLTTHPLEIRLAGLDHDPGFVPAAGRTIAFHFE